jgi:hypothetical protein
MSEQNSGNAGIAQNPAAQTQDVQAQQAGASSQSETIELARYKELEAFATKARQNEIANAVRLAKLDPKSVNEIGDIKVQNAVVKELYGLDTLAQAKEVYGDTFYDKKDGEDKGEDELYSIRKELKLLKVKQESEAVDNAIKALRLSNPELLKSEKDEESLRKEMSLISSQLSPEERVKKAARLAFGDVSVNRAKELMDMQSAAGALPAAGARENKNEAQEQINARANAIAAFAFQGRTFVKKD